MKLFFDIFSGVVIGMFYSTCIASWVKPFRPTKFDDRIYNISVLIFVYFGTYALYRIFPTLQANIPFAGWTIIIFYFLLLFFFIVNFFNPYIPRLKPVSQNLVKYTLSFLLTNLVLVFIKHPVALFLFHKIGSVFK